MIDFVWWWYFLALPLPFLVYRFMRPVSTSKESALYVPFYRNVIDVTTGTGLNIQTPASRTVLLVLAWILLVGSIARPVWLAEPLALPLTGRDLMLAVDISGSMEENDFEYRGRQLSRLQAVKTVAGEFIERRKGDRIGLILFGTRAYVQTPLTFDLKTVRHFLDEAVIGLAGENTSLGDAIGLAVKRLRERPRDTRVLVLLTDGSNTSGMLAPDDAASLARAEGIKIHTIGVGANERGGLFGMLSARSRPLDEKSLVQIADVTGGKYFRARDIDELNQVYALIEELEPADADEQQYRPRKELYAWPLFGFSLLALVMLWRSRT